MTETPIKILRLGETEVAYERAAEMVMRTVREANIPMVVKCTPNGMVYLDSIHNGTSPKLTVAVIDPRPVKDRPAYREHHLEDDLRTHAKREGIDTGHRWGRWSGRNVQA